MGRFCSECGNELPENAALCVKCGKAVEEKTVAVETAKKKGLPTWAIVLIVVGGIVVVAIVCLTILINSIFKVGSEVITKSADKVIGEIEEHADKGSLNEYAQKFEEFEKQFEEQFKED